MLKFLNEKFQFLVQLEKTLIQSRCSIYSTIMRGFLLDFFFQAVCLRIKIRTRNQLAAIFRSASGSICVFVREEKNSTNVYRSSKPVSWLTLDRKKLKKKLDLSFKTCNLLSKLAWRAVHSPPVVDRSREENARYQQLPKLPFGLFAKRPTETLMLPVTHTRQ